MRVPLRYHRKKDGSVIPVEITGRYFKLHGKSMHIAAIRDISERLKTEQKIAKQMEELQRWYSVTIDREKRVIELKQEVNTLMAKLKELPERYKGVKSIDLTAGPEQ